jgi:hypothetical protein
MKTPDHRPRFQSATRHYHRYREDRRDWADWIDPVKKSSSKRRGWWLAALVVLGVAAVIGSVWYQVP